MLFNVKTTRWLYCPEYVKKLEDIGFIFKIVEKEYGVCFSDRKELSALEKINDYVEVEINSLEQLRDFGIKFGDIIIDFSNKEIEIYDDYRE